MTNKPTRKPRSRSGHHAGGSTCIIQAEPPEVTATGNEAIGLSVDEKLGIVREARLTFGVTAAKGLWTRLGLPEPEMDGRSAVRKRAMQRHFQKFLAERANLSPAAMATASELHDAFNGWAARGNAPPCTKVMIGHLAKSAGIEKRKSCGNVVYLGVQLRDRPKRIGELFP